MERVLSFLKNQISFRHLTRVTIFVTVLGCLRVFSGLFTQELKESSVVRGLTSIYKDFGFSKHLKVVKNALSSTLIPKRKLGAAEAENKTVLNPAMMVFQDLFFTNISDFIYHGNWTSLDKFDNFPDFENNLWGKLSVRFVSKLKRTAANHPRINQTDSVKANFYLYDGIYKDRWFNFNISVDLPRNESSLKIDLSEIIVNYTYGEIMEKLYEGSKDLSNVEFNFSLRAEFVREEKTFLNGFVRPKTAEYSSLKGKMTFNNSYVDFSTEINDDSVSIYLKISTLLRKPGTTPSSSPSSGLSKSTTQFNFFMTLSTLLILALK
jgi:hypothetical protein